jgi:reactive intermediate/imine deaminase
MRHLAIAIAVIPVLATLVHAQQVPVMKHTNPDSLSKPAGYTHLVEVTGGRTIYVSGQIALDKAGHVVGAGDLRAQATQVFENLKAALAASGATFANVAKITVFMTDVAQIQAFRDVRDKYITGEPPASTLVQVVRLARPELLIEVEAVAVIEGGK